MAAVRQVIIDKQKGTVPNYQSVISTLDSWLCSCGNGQYILSLKRKQTKRSISQNSLMWLWFAAIAQAWEDATGWAWNAQDVHDAYCLMFLPKNTPKGRIAGSTSALTTEQMTEFLNKVQADAQTEYGIQLPNPEDQYFETWAEQYNNQ